jgi:hypothetical protein
MKNITIVTGLWDLGRDQLGGWAHRTFDTYKDRFFDLLSIDVNMAIWIPRELEEEVWKIRKKENTFVYFKEVEDFKNWFPFFEKLDAIRTNPEWQNKAGWLPESPQAALPMYNPMMMTKVFMVNDTAILNPFNSEYFYWIDGGLTSTVCLSNFTEGNVFENISNAYPYNIVHISYPYEPYNEIHGYEKNSFYKRCGLSNDEKIVHISRGGFFGGPKEKIHRYNEVYYEVLEKTIKAGEMGADECLFTILAYNHPDLISRFPIQGNGLVYPFFEHYKNAKISNHNKNYSNNLYILSFNSPEQFESVIKSIKLYDPILFDKSKKILINNSIDKKLFEEYDRLCLIYDFEEIHENNIGVCGGRQRVAEHFNSTDADFYMFFEDDMHFAQEKDGIVCRNGFIRKIDNFYNKIIGIIKKEKFDFLKFSFSEFFGENNVQWSWYNVPQEVRTKVWPNYDKLPKNGLDPNPPRVEFKNIEIFKGVPYITGDVYYSNWPQIVTRDGNKKMFLDTKWSYPTEQTWMSHLFQMTKRNELRGAVLLASPIEHNRFNFYEGNLRKEF